MNKPAISSNAMVQITLCLGIIALQFFGAFAGLESLFIEKRAELAPRQASQKIVYIAIDHQSLEQIGVWPWPRSVHAKVIEALVEAEAADIVFDVDFSSRSDPNEDRKLLEALQMAGGSVVFPTFVQQQSVRSVEGSPHVQTMPLAMFQEDSWMASVRVTPDSDGIVRSFYLGVHLNQETIPSAAAILAARSDVDTGRFLIDYSIDPSSVPTYSVSDLLAGAVPDAALRDKSVIIGAHALELRDTFAVPVHSVIPGTMLQILAAETLLQNRSLVPSSIWLTASLVLLVLAVALTSSIKFGLAVRLAILGLLSAVVETAAFFLQKDYAIALSTVPVHAAVAVLAVFTAVTELNLLALVARVAKIENRNTRKVLSQVFADSADGFLVVGKSGEVLEINENFKKLFKLTDEQLSAECIFDALPKGVVADIRKAIAKFDGQTLTPVARSEFRDRVSGVERVVEYSVTPSVLTGLQSENGENDDPVFASVTARDVSVEREQRAKLEYLSKFDDLTGAMRRREYVKVLNQHLVDLCSGGGRAVVVAININRFNALNRTLGRTVGDLLLQAIASRLEHIELAVSRPARLEGDTFVMHLVSDISKSGARHLADKLIRELSKPYELENMQVSADFYAGVAETSDLLRQDADGLISNAELALESARGLSGNVAYFDPKDVAQQERALLIEREMRDGLREGQFWVTYQPQVATDDGALTGAEALLRWTHPELGPVSPGEFIEIAEANGFILQLGKWVLEQACRDACRWPGHITVAVNVSAKQFLRGSVVEDVKQALAKSGLAAHRLELEITESSFLHATDDLLVQLAQLKKLGVSLSLDDFGTGYSSFGYLANFPVDKIKIDKMFLQNMTGERASQSVVRSAQVLAEGLGMKVLCEGVETAEQYQIVRGIGCQQIQGYYFGKPQSADDIAAMINHAGTHTLTKAG
ncbi:EAL domain-containing protein [Hoeflea sp. TYP-13]|uniref:EAL domain-containing protein n=1 Tax=Hoeflea sp. TYP-13 TaxID=3230023 RepID=UPI0034C69EA6